MPLICIIGDNLKCTYKINDYRLIIPLKIAEYIAVLNIKTYNTSHVNVCQRIDPTGC